MDICTKSFWFANDGWFHFCHKSRQDIKNVQKNSDSPTCWINYPQNQMNREEDDNKTVIYISCIYFLNLWIRSLTRLAYNEEQSMA